MKLAKTREQRQAYKQALLVQAITVALFVTAIVAVVVRNL